MCGVKWPSIFNDRCIAIIDIIDNMWRECNNDILWDLLIRSDKVGAGHIGVWIVKEFLMRQINNAYVDMIM
jgi:hypothetical protein